MVVSERDSDGGTCPKRCVVCCAAFLDANAVDSAGPVVDNEPRHLMVCVPVCLESCALVVAGFVSKTNGA
jgi:hypothetical protein